MFVNINCTIDYIHLMDIADSWLYNRYLYYAHEWEHFQSIHSKKNTKRYLKEHALENQEGDLLMEELTHVCLVAGFDINNVLAVQKSMGRHNRKAHGRYADVSVYNLSDKQAENLVELVQLH